jgi:cytochrome c oxidase cbb3-type subunit 3
VTPRARRATTLLTLTATLWAAGCERSDGGSTVTTRMQPAATGAVVEAVPLGALAGATRDTTAQSIANPYEGNAQAVAQGHDLFVRMNCAGCHGYGAKGSMGPDLTDTYWRYGGTPVQIYQSISQGRPKGMPAWNPALPPDDIWKLVSYIESLGGASSAANYQAALQGDRPGELVAPELAASGVASSEAASGPVDGVPAWSSAASAASASQ